MKRSGTADLPLHGGRVPAWLANRMMELGTAIAEHIVMEYGPGELLTRLSDPFWFQALGCVMGMDWYAGAAGGTPSVLPRSCARSLGKRDWMEKPWLGPAA